MYLKILLNRTSDPDLCQIHGSFFFFLKISFLITQLDPKIYKLYLFLCFCVIKKRNNNTILLATIEELYLF